MVSHRFTNQEWLINEPEMFITHRNFVQLYGMRNGLYNKIVTYDPLYAIRE